MKFAGFRTTQFAGFASSLSSHVGNGFAVQWKVRAFHFALCLVATLVPFSAAIAGAYCNSSASSCVGPLVGEWSYSWEPGLNVPNGYVPSNNFRSIDDAVQYADAAINQYYAPCNGSITSESFPSWGSTPGTGLVSGGASPNNWSYEWTLGEVFTANSADNGFPYALTGGPGCNLHGDMQTLIANRSVVCPAGYQQNNLSSPSYDNCFALFSQPLPGKNCGQCQTQADDPIQVGQGYLSQTDTDFTLGGSFPIALSRTYDSSVTSVANTYGWSDTGFGYGWVSRYTARLHLALDGNTPTIFSSRANGQILAFKLVNSSWTPDADIADQLQALSLPNGTPIGWSYSVAADRSIEFYDTSGRLTAIENADGREQVLYYDPHGRLLSIADDQGHSVQVGYNDTQAPLTDQITNLTLSDGTSYSYTYSGGNLLSVTYPDGSQRVYLHENSDFPHTLTGIEEVTPANVVSRYSTYEYDSQHRAYHSYRAGGANEARVVFSGNESSTLTETIDPAASLVSSTTFTFGVVLGVEKITAMSAPCVQCGANFRSASYDTDGYPQSRTDFNGRVTNYTYDDTRGLETKRVEAVGTSEQRTTNTQWNPNFRVPDERDVDDANGTESLTKWAYNTRGQASARCEVAPAVSGASSYVCGSSPNAPAGLRQWAYTYCEQADVTAGTCPLVGLLKQTDGPRTDVSDVTAYSYHLSDDPSCTPTPTLCSHRKGDLWKITNARGQVTTYLSYDPNGRVTRMQDANGVYTDMTYHSRGWLLTRTVRANADGTPNASLDATTTFGYDNVGNVTSIVQPDGTAMEYAYDAAHRLTDIYDSPDIANTANSDHIQYTLDAAGNRTNESTYDPGNTLRRALTRQYDQLNHLVAVLNGSTPSAVVQQFENPPPPETPPLGTTDGYDGNGNAFYSVDANGVGTEQQYDPLNRLKKTLQDHAGSGSTKDTTTQYAYDARDNLLSVTDPDSLVTSYTYDGLNNLTQLQSPDTGTTTYGTATQPGYDAAGNRLMQTDANGITTTYTYDALNRLTGIAYPTTSLNVTYAYDVPATGCYNVGRLTQITDSSGSTTYCYDQRGNVATKTQVTNGTTLTTGYTYTLADRVRTITYPSGAVVTYGRDTVGRITSVKYQANATATAQTIASNASYYPFGPLNTLTFGNGRTLTKTYDQNYAIGTVASSDPNGLVISAGVDALGNLTHASNGTNPPSQTYGYDNLYRLTGVTDSNDNTVEAYTYGLTGDRQSKTYQGDTNTYDYTSPLTTHQLQDVDGVGRDYDANGNLINVGGGFRYRGTQWSYNFDDRNRLSGASSRSGCLACSHPSATYDYNGRGERVTKSVTVGNVQFNNLVTTTTDYVYNESGQLLGEYPGTSGVQTAEYIYLDATPIAYVTNGTLYYLETDQLGTPRNLIQPGDTTANDTIVWKWDYFGSAFGENDPDEDPNSTGTSFTFNLRFPGQYYDAETGLSYNYFRDYEPGTGRYVESDPIGLSAGTNTYAYVSGTPLTGIDPSGLMEWTGDFTQIGFSVGGGVGLFHFYGKTKCVHGKQGIVFAQGFAGGLGWGPKWAKLLNTATGSTSVATFEDNNLDEIDPNVFDGYFATTSVGYAIPGVSGYGCSKIQMGGAHSKIGTRCSHQTGLDLSLSALYGHSWATGFTVDCTDCENK